MPTNIEAISDLVEVINSTATPFLQKHPYTEEQRAALALAAEQLAIAAREPEENVYYVATQTAQNAAIRSVIAMGVFDEMPQDGSYITVAELATRLRVDEEILMRILRACASTHFFREVGPSKYGHSALSSAYIIPENRNMTAQMYDFTCKGVFALPEFGVRNSWQRAGSYDHGPFQLGAGTSLGFWDYLKEKPERMELFNAGMRSQTTIGSGRKSGVFPFGAVLAGNPCEDHEIAIVDVGGGRGQALEAIKQDYPELRGRFILQDVKDVIEDARRQGLPDMFETCVGSFFEPLEVKGARIYHFRRIFHDWDQGASRKILEVTRQAMNLRSRIVIADMVLPDVGATRDMALQDLNMMSFGGMERTESQWRDLVASAGLVLRQIWKGNAGAKHAIIEVVLPTFEDC